MSAEFAAGLFPFAAVLVVGIAVRAGLFVYDCISDGISAYGRFGRE